MLKKVYCFQKSEGRNGLRYRWNVEKHKSVLSSVFVVLRITKVKHQLRVVQNVNNVFSYYLIKNVSKKVFDNAEHLCSCSREEKMLDKKLK